MNLVILGEALVDVVPDAGQPTGSRDLPGGSPANVAVTLGRLGHEPTLVTALADDARGAMVRAWLEASDVRVQAEPPATGRTSSATVVLGADGGAAYDFDLSWSISQGLADAVAPIADVLHTGSIATVLDPGAGTVEAALTAARGRALISFDPNARPAITPDVAAVRERVERLVALSDVVKVSEEDLEWYYPDADATEVARRWADAGPVLVVVTLGGEGAILVRDGVTAQIDGVPVTVADTIGAGDTFMGALLDALVRLRVHGPDARSVLSALTAEQLAEAASWAARAAAVTVSRPGADPPRRAELLAG